MCTLRRRWRWVYMNRDKVCICWLFQGLVDMDIDSDLLNVKRWNGKAWTKARTGKDSNRTIMVMLACILTIWVPITAHDIGGHQSIQSYYRAVLVSGALVSPKHLCPSISLYLWDCWNPALLSNRSFASPPPLNRFIYTRRHVNVSVLMDTGK